MNPMLEIYRLALEKQAGLGSFALKALKGVGRIGASIPFYWAGSAMGEKAMGKKPETQQVFVAPEKFKRMQMIQARMAGGAQGRPGAISVQGGYQNAAQPGL